MVVYPVMLRQLLPALLLIPGLVFLPRLTLAQGTQQPAARGAGPVTYGCEESNYVGSYYLHEGRQVFDDSKHAAYPLRLNTPVYQNSTGDARSPRTLKFGERVGIIDPGAGTDRLKVKDSTNAQPIGWVARSSLFCNENPIRDTGTDGSSGTGLYKRVVVRTETAVQGQVVKKQLFETPAGSGTDQRCETRCAEASRFQWFFIYAEENDHYLISSFAHLRNNRAVFEGWLPKRDGYLWNTALGLRPREDLPPLPAAPPRTDRLEGFICAYRTEQELAGNTGCNQIIGGRRWFGLDVRMAVLSETPKHYEVLFSNASTAGRRLDIEGLNRLDVFFVIDGTKSMSAAIEAIKQLTNTINQKIKSKFDQGGVVRYGFRVYRDSAKSGADGVTNSEFLALPKDKCGETNEVAFDRAFRPVKALDPIADDDFPENSFGGIAQATEDAGGCLMNNKMIVVIGDHGYDAAKQQSRGHRPWTEADLVKRLQERLGKNAMLLFVQIPREAGAGTEYTKAYREFEVQGRGLLSSYYQGTPIGQGNTWANHFITLPPGTPTSAAAVDTTWRQVDHLVQPANVAALGREIERGVGLKEAIDRVRNNSKENIPVLWTLRANEVACPQIGRQCEDTIYEQVTHAFVKKEGTVVPEVLLSRDQVDNWLRILNVFKTSPTGRVVRDALISNWQAAIGDVMQVHFQSSALPMGTVAQLAGGLPNSARSKLMQYPDGMLRNTTTVPDCEIEYLKQYSGKRYDMLNIVYGSDGRLRPIFREGQPPAGACANLSPTGRNIPFIDGAITPEALNRSNEQTSYSMMHPRSGFQFFWIPVSYLP